MIARLLLSLTMIVTMVGAATTAEAVCQNGGTDNYRRHMVAQPPDVFFKAGTPSTQEIPVVFVTYNAVGAPQLYSDCGTVAVSSIPGVLVEDTYCAWGSGCDFGQTAQVDKSQPDAGSASPGTYRHFEVNHLRPIRVSYDGRATAGTTGTVTIAMADEFGNPVSVIGKVNVYVVGTRTAPTWFTVTSTKRTISGDSLILDNEYLNVQPGARVFAMHYGAKGYWDHPVAVTYDAWRARWLIRNEDGAAMPVGASFHVRIDPSAAMLTTPHNYATNYLVIDDPVANYNPFATIVVTPWSSGNRRMRGTFAVQYVAPYWRVVFTDGTNMPVSDYTAIPYNNAGFFVKIIGSSSYADDRYGTVDPSGFLQTHKSNGAGVDIAANSARLSGDAKLLRTFCWATGTVTPLIATMNMTPLPYPAPMPGHYFWETARYGATFIGDSSAIYHENGTMMNALASFNVMAPPRASCAPTIP